jgi:hypothetical protein
MNPRAMVLGWRGDRNSRQVITFSLERRPRQSQIPRGEQMRERANDVSATLGMLAMLPVVFGVAGYTMVSR